MRAELNGQFKPAFTNSDIAFGVNDGGKNSIDVTYLAAAEATGHVRVEVLHVVTDISMDNDKRWVLHIDRIDTDGDVVETKEIVANSVFLNAGSGGTTRLMVKAKAKGLIPDLPDAIGTQWGSNGDRIYAWIQMDEHPGSVQGGPACVGGQRPGPSGDRDPRRFTGGAARGRLAGNTRRLRHRQGGRHLGLRCSFR